MALSLSEIPVFDSHFHIIDPRFPLVANQGFLPQAFPCEAYLEATRHFRLMGGTVVSGSFQSFDQSYLVAALEKLGAGFVGVTQLPFSASDAEILRLDVAGVRGVRFNLHRGGSLGMEHLERMAKRIHELAGWHVEIYADLSQRPEMVPLLEQLPAVSIAHLGLSDTGFGALLRLVEKGVRVKASGFGRVDFDVSAAIEQICSVNPEGLMFGTDLPSTRVLRPYCPEDAQLILNCLDETTAHKVLHENARTFYGLSD